MDELEQFLSDPFHSCALAAYAAVMAETGQFPPDSDTVKQRAYAYYEEEKRRG
jgi:hypothetical protein